MKKVGIALGGHHMLGDDLLFLQSALTEGLLQFIHDFVGDFVIISGVDAAIVGGNIVWSAGWIYMSGELLQVDAGSVVNSTSNQWEIVESYDPAGNQEYEDLNTEDTYIIRKAKIGTAIVGSLTWNTPKKFKHWRNWNGMTGGGSWSVFNGFYGTNVIGEVIARGYLTVASYNVGTDTVLFNITSGSALRPENTRYILVAALKNAVPTFIQLKIETNGDVKPQGLSSTDAVTIYLDSFRYLIRE